MYVQGPSQVLSCASSHPLQSQHWFTNFSAIVTASAAGYMFQFHVQVQVSGLFFVLCLLKLYLYPPDPAAGGFHLGLQWWSSHAGIESQAERKREGKRHQRPIQPLGDRPHRTCREMLLGCETSKFTSWVVRHIRQVCAWHVAGYLLHPHWNHVL